MQKIYWLEYVNYDNSDDFTETETFWEKRDFNRRKYEVGLDDVIDCGYDWVDLD